MYVAVVHVEISRGAANSPTDLSRASRPKFAILRVHVEEVLLFNKFFSDCQYVP